MFMYVHTEHLENKIRNLNRWYRILQYVGIKRYIEKIMIIISVDK